MPTPAPTQTPEQVKPQTPEVQKDETVKVEDKNITEKDSSEVLDASPKTGDSSELGWVYKIMIAAAFACVASVATNIIINKRRKLN